MMSVLILLATGVCVWKGAVLFCRKTLFKYYFSAVVGEFLYIDVPQGHVSLIQLLYFLNVVVTLELHCIL